MIQERSTFCPTLWFVFMCCINTNYVSHRGEAAVSEVKRKNNGTPIKPKALNSNGIANRKIQPVIAHFYNKLMGTVDQADAGIHRHRITNRQPKWTHAGFVFFIRLVIHNAWIVLQQQDTLNG